MSDRGLVLLLALAALALLVVATATGSAVAGWAAVVAFAGAVVAYARWRLARRRA